jgi:SAM-dependent methyltransferase
MASSDEILDLLDLPVRGAVVGAALELGLFWALADGARTTESLASTLGTPAGRCAPLLELLAMEGLLEQVDEGWALTAAARTAIVHGYSPTTWQMLAEEARERLQAVGDLPAALRAEPAQQPRVPGYVEEMVRNPARARRFTRMLYEVHQPLARQLTAALDLGGVRRLMDLGGGSGVVGMALARRWPELEVTVVDVATVCDAGREIAAEQSLADRVSYLEADFMADPLPGGFDAVLECDVAIYSAQLFRKVRGALATGGRFIIADAFAPDRPAPELESAEPPSAPRSELAWILVRRLRDPAWQAPTVAGTRALLREAGFGSIASTPLPAMPGVGGRSQAPTILEAR